MNMAGNERLCDGVGVGVVVWDYSGVLKPINILLVQRLDGTWCFPGGKLRFMEAGNEAAARELNEEAGLKVETKDLGFLGLAEEAFVNSKGEQVHFVSIMFSVCKACVEGEAKPDMVETIDAQWFPYNKLPENLYPSTKITNKLWQTRQYPEIHGGYISLNKEVK